MLAHTRTTIRESWRLHWQRKCIGPALPHETTAKAVAVYQSQRQSTRAAWENMHRSELGRRRLAHHCNTAHSTHTAAPCVYTKAINTGVRRLCRQTRAKVSKEHGNDAYQRTAGAKVTSVCTPTVTPTFPSPCVAVLGVLITVGSAPTKSFRAGPLCQGDGASRLLQAQRQRHPIQTGAWIVCLAGGQNITQVY